MYHQREKCCQSRGRQTALKAFYDTVRFGSSSPFQITISGCVHFEKSNEDDMTITEDCLSMTSQLCDGSMCYFNLNHSNNLTVMLIQTVSMCLADAGGRIVVACWSLPKYHSFQHSNTISFITKVFSCPARLTQAANRGIVSMKTCRCSASMMVHVLCECVYRF